MYKMEGRENSKNIFFPSETERKLVVQMSQRCPGFTRVPNQKTGYSLDACQASLLEPGPLGKQVLNTLGEEEKRKEQSVSGMCAVPGHCARCFALCCMFGTYSSSVM